MSEESIVLENHPNDSRMKIKTDGVFQTLSSRMGTGGNNTPMIMQRGAVMNDGEYVVRRLTPLECERLQGYPDGWTDIGDWVADDGKTRKCTDANRYKALGNSLALPFWAWMAERMAKHLPGGATMASLFDGIGGFPLVYQAAGVKAVWASEIEEFPIAVTKLRFPEEGD